MPFDLVGARRADDPRNSGVESVIAVCSGCRVNSQISPVGLAEDSSCTPVSAVVPESSVLPARPPASIAVPAAPPVRMLLLPALPLLPAPPPLPMPEVSPPAPPSPVALVFGPPALVAPADVEVLSLDGEVEALGAHRSVKSRRAPTEERPNLRAEGWRWQST